MGLGLRQGCRGRVRRVRPKMAQTRVPFALDGRAEPGAAHGGVPLLIEFGSGYEDVALADAVVGEAVGG